jgi:hypothetical protein
VALSDPPCPVCGGAPFHHLGCPALERYLWVTLLVLGSLTVLETVVALSGGHHGDLRPAVALTLFFAVLVVVSRRRRKHTGQ